MVFQNYALYPHMTVRDNMSFALMLAKRSKAEIERAREEGRRHPRPRPVSRPLSAPALRRPAAARGDGPRDRARPAGVPVRRAAVQPRRQAARADAHRDQGAAPAAEDHVDLRHARPDRGDDDGRQDRRDARRHRRADRRPARPLRSSGEHVRRRLHRLAGDEHHSRHGADGRRRARASSSATASRCRCPRAPAPTTASRCSTACGPSTARSAPAACRCEVVVVEPTGADTQLYCRFNGQEVTATIGDRTDCRPGDRINLAPDLGAGASVRRGERFAARRMSCQTGQRGNTRSPQPKEECMSDIKRRDFLKATAGVAAGSALGAGSALVRAGRRTRSRRSRRRRARSCACCAGSASCRATRTCGRRTRRSSREMTGIEVRVDAEGWEDVRPKAAVAANVGSGHLGQGCRTRSGSNTPEKGAKLRVLRWKRFVQGDEDVWAGQHRRSSPRRPASRCASTPKAGKTCGPRRRWRRTSAAARTSSSARSRTRTSIRRSCVDVTDVANYLGNKYGGWYPACQGLLHARQEVDRRSCWAPPATRIVYRESHDEGGGLRQRSRRTWPASSSCARR